MKTFFVPMTVLCSLLLGGGALAANGANSPLEPCPPSATGQMQQPQEPRPYQGTSMESPGIVGERFYEDPATSDDPVNKHGIPDSSKPAEEQPSE